MGEILSIYWASSSEIVRSRRENWISRTWELFQFLTAPGDIVVDIFSGSNTTGQVAEKLQRNWLSIELNRDYAAFCAIQFMEGWDEGSIR